MSSHVQCVHCGGTQCTCYDTDEEYIEAATAASAMTVERIVGALLRLDCEQRMNVFRQFCPHCGSDNPRCQCMNDEQPGADKMSKDGFRYVWGGHIYYDAAAKEWVASSYVAVIGRFKKEQEAKRAVIANANKYKDENSDNTERRE